MGERLNFASIVWNCRCLCPRKENECEYGDAFFSGFVYPHPHSGPCFLGGDLGLLMTLRSGTTFGRAQSAGD